MGFFGKFAAVPLKTAGVIRIYRGQLSSATHTNSRCPHSESRPAEDFRRLARSAVCPFTIFTALRLKVSAHVVAEKRRVVGLGLIVRRRLQPVERHDCPRVGSGRLSRTRGLSEDRMATATDRGASEKGKFCSEIVLPLIRNTHDTNY